MAEIVQSACPLNCWDNCGFHVTVDAGKVKKIDGNPNHPITKGKICGRGRMLEARTNSSERLLYPLKKINGQFERISWDQALNEIAAKLQYLKESFGTTSVLHSHDYANGGLLKNLDSRFFNNYGGVTEITGSICWGSGIEGQSWDFGDAYSHGPEDLINSKQIVIWGRNVARTNMHFFENLQNAKRNGAKLIVIDPIYNATAKIAHQYISVQPGMDGILAAGIMKEMLRLGLEDRHFIKNHTIGFKHLEGVLETISIDEVSELTGVPVMTITELAVLYSEGPTSSFFGLGMQRYANGGNTIRLLDALVAVSGNVGIQGGGANYANRQVGQSFNVQALSSAHKKTASRQFLMMKQAESILAAKDPEIKMIIVTCGNPLTQVPDTNRVRQAFTSVETLVVIDQFMTDTAELADYVLPTTTAFEEEDIYYSSMYHHYANYGPKLVDAPGEAKSDLWIWTELANRLGFGAEFAHTRSEWLELGLESLSGEGVTLEKIKQDSFAELPVDTVPWRERIFKTPSGKYEFLSAAAIKKGRQGELSLSLPHESRWSQPELAEKYPFTLLSIHPLRSNHSQHYHLLNGPERIKVEVSPDIAKKRKLADNDFVRVWNERGELNGYVSIMKQAHPGTINIDEGTGRKYGGAVNLLTSSDVSDNGLGSTVYDCLVNVEKV
ncbi:molybdopterin-dependent oxidoreductase [Bacillus canaveralius]|uniref:molybdopterin-dependent oxidoreductase n=1 Tax=Bacillus canaveralius TaxID=1403243 RepID=UPI000F785EFB|nr:molybdopterin-dependent oxidoreductase [Bacillus canaveralius]RSK52138.1 oxidoreductase [Bacillus canaveralius]